MNRANLADLPDEIFLDIVEHLDTARDVAHLGATSRRANDLVERDGWVPFVRRHFPSLKVSRVEPGQWRGVADRLTYYDKCWEKRGFALSEYTQKKGQHGQGKKQSVAPSTVVHASLLESDKREYVTWGAGEDLVVQSMPSHGKYPQKKRRWRELLGTSQGYLAGTGDITALSLIDREKSPQVVVGRANGSLQLLSLGQKTFGEVEQELDLPVTRTLRTQGPSLPSPGQSAVSWTEWNDRSNLLATGQSSTVALFDLGNTTSKTLAPVATEVLGSADGSDLGLVRSLKFINKDTIVMALGASFDPVRCAKVTPTGLVFESLCKPSLRIQETLRLHRESDIEPKTTVRALETVGNGYSSNILLSAWGDGTYRLQDIRTPSAFDAVYCNRLLPYDAGSSLLVYGTERFVAGSNSRPNIFLFDFRQPKPYHWTTAAACSPEEPYPQAPGDGASKVNGYDHENCQVGNGHKCHWHGASLHNNHRPDATLMFGERNYDRVHSLAKASDTSPSFWIGLRGGVYESRMMLAEDAALKNLRGSALPPGWQVGRPETKITLVETGMGVRSASDWDDSRWAISMAEWDFKFRAGRVKPKEKRSRLDPSVSKMA